MPEYCVTFLNVTSDDPETDEVVFHTHVSASLDRLALERALHAALDSNVSLKRANHVAIKSVDPLPAEIMEGIEMLRVVRHGHAPAPVVAPSGHVH